MKQKLLLLAVALICSVGVWAYTSVVPQVGRTYYLYNMGTGKYWHRASDKYEVVEGIANATPITIESGYKLAYVYEGTTYRIHHDNGTQKPWQTEGVNFTFEGSADGQYGYQLKSKHSDYDRWMCPDGTFQQNNKFYDRNWQFIACEEAMTSMSTFCAGVAGANYVQSSKGWERVTSISELQTNPEDYFFAIFSANAAGLMVQTDASTGHGYYLNGTNPLSNSAYLFNIENYSYNSENYFVMKAGNTNAYYHAENNAAYDLVAKDQPSVDDDCRLVFEYADNAWNIKTWTSYSGDSNSGSYWGLWTPGEGYMNGKKMAGNKNDAEKGSFLIYRIPRYKLDMTSRITNPSFETDDDGHVGATGWTLGSTNNDTKVHLNSNPTYTMSNVDGDKLFNTWDGDGTGYTISQTLSNMPAGIYKLTAVMGAFEGQTLQLIANDVTGTAPSEGKETGVKVTTYVTLASPGNLTIQAKTAASAFYKVDNFRLTYIASSLTEDLTAASGIMNAVVNTAQQNAVSTYNDNKTIENYIDAMDAIAAAKTSVAAYAKAKTYLESVEAVLATTNFYTPTAYASVYGTYKTAYDARTLADATADGLTYKVASYEGDQRYDNNTANDLLIPGWTFDGTDAAANHTNLYINTRSTEDNSNGFANPFYEYWVADNLVISPTTIVGALSGLTANKYYKVTAKVRVRETNSSTKVANSITMQVGSGDKVDVTAGTQISTTPRYVGQFSAIGQADGDGNLVLTFDVASGSNISWLSFRDVNYSDPTPEAKAVLLSTINDANTLYNSGANVGSGVFQIPTAAGTTFSNAIATAQGVYDNASSTYEEVLSANSTLQTAITTYEGVTLNAPTGGTRYKLTLADRGTLTYQTASTEGGYGMPFKAAGDYMAQTFTFTQVSGNTYTMSFEDFDGNTRYICTRAQYGEGGTGTYGIRSFVAGEGGKTALPITIKATTTANVFNMLNTECDNKKLGSNGGDFYTDNAYTSWSIAEATQAEVTVSCKAGKYGTVIFPFTPDVSTGFDNIKFYSCASVNNSYTQIEEVSTPEANTPYIIKNNGGSDFSKTISGFSVAEESSYTVGLLTGVYTNAYIPVSDASNSYYVLQTKDDVQAFYKVEDADFPGTPYKCYLTLPATHVKAFLFPEDPTAINAIETAENENTEIYNLAGQRLSKAQKGVNIVNGKKVLVK
ncbi:MAG: hypothetical protein E7105_04880 [Prevotella sp.]|nr:hypothetical protein [Prevotella sp.]